MKEERRYGSGLEDAAAVRKIAEERTRYDEAGINMILTSTLELTM